MDAVSGSFDSAPYEEMSATLLSQQPPTLPEKLVRNDFDWGVTFSHLESRLGMLRTWRYSWWAYWSVLAEFFIPRRYKWLVVANKMSRGRPINEAIIDSTGLLSVNICASGLWTGLTNPARPWFKFAPAFDSGPLDSDAQAWLEETEARVYQTLAGSNFYSTMAQAFQDVTVFGTAPVIIYEDDETVIRCYLPCAGEYYLGSSPRFAVDTLYREFTLTVAQIVGMFTLENCPPQVRALWETGGGSLENEFVVAHAIEPNFALSGRGGASGKKVSVVPGKFPYREVYWLKGQKTNKPLSVRGFMRKPFFAARWSTVSNDAYGRSPCMDALGDNKQIQVETFRKGEFINKGVRPPMGADPTLKNEPSSILPAMITYINTDGGKKGFWPLFEVDPQWLMGLEKDIAGISNRIERALFVDVFMAITRMQGVQPRNELELTKRDLERLQVLGPFVSLFKEEFAQPAIMSVVDILEQRRMLRPRPQSLQGVPIKIEFVSIMRLAQRSAESVAMKDTFVTAGQLSAAAKAAAVPDPLRRMNLDMALERYADLNGFPLSLFFSEEEVQSHDRARAQAKQQQEVLPTTMAGVSAAKTLSDTSVAGGSLLNSLLTGETIPQ